MHSIHKAISLHITVRVLREQREEAVSRVNTRIEELGTWLANTLLTLNDEKT